MYAPKGIAGLYMRPGLVLEPIIYGGGQEHGLRAGTENVALTVALGAAAELARADLANGGPQRLQARRDRLHRTLTHALPGRVLLNGHPARRLHNTLNIRISGARGDELLAATPDAAASTGSACHAGTTEPSPVLTAMGLDRHRALAAIRLSVGRWTSDQDIDRAAVRLTDAYRRLGRRAAI
jgi:cysteine desulfurase